MLNRILNKTTINNAKRFYTCSISPSFQYLIEDSLRHIKIINIVGFLILLIKLPSEKLLIENDQKINKRLIDIEIQINKKI
jgi:hypothetical protein